MIELIVKLTGFIQSVDGATAIEYGLIAGGIALAIVAAVFALGSDLNSVFNVAGNAMQSAANGGG